MGSARRRQRVIFVATSAAALVACNAIIGVSEVTLRESKEKGSADAVPDAEVMTDGDAPIEDNRSLALGFLHGCARLPAGDVRCWGNNGSGELGDGVPFDAGNRLLQSNKPVVVPGINDAISIGAGHGHTCVVRRSGKVSCWGANAVGQLGDGTTVDSPSPVDVLSISDATEVVGGTLFTCARRVDNTVACWGENGSGQLGDNTVVNRPTAAPVKQLSDVVSLSAGRNHACAVLSSGEVMCWGKNGSGQLGIGSTVDARLPTKLNSLNDIVQVAGASRFSCARQRWGRVYCWGTNAEGQLGNGSPTPAPNPSPILVPSLGDAIWIWTGYEHACAVKRGGAVVCWGRGLEGQLGTGLLPDGGAMSPVSTPSSVLGAPASVTVFTGGHRSCALSTDGRAFCWGSNAFGQLANGTDEPAFSATAMVGFP